MNETWETRWEAYNQTGRRLFGVGDYPQAEQAFENAIREAARAGTDNLQLASSLSNLGQLKCKQREFGQAEALVQRSLDIRERVLGAEHHDLIQPLTTLGMLHATHGKTELAEACFRRALAIGEQHGGPEHPELAVLLNNLARLHFRCGNFATAGEFLTRVLEIKRKSVGEDHPEVAAVLRSLAKVRYAQVDYDGAEALTRQALAIRMRLEAGDAPTAQTQAERAQEESDGATGLPVAQQAAGAAPMPSESAPSPHAEAALAALEEAARLYHPEAIENDEGASASRAEVADPIEVPEPIEIPEPIAIPEAVEIPEAAEVPEPAAVAAAPASRRLWRRLATARRSASWTRPPSWKVGVAAAVVVSVAGVSIALAHGGEPAQGALASAHLQARTATATAVAETGTEAPVARVVDGALSQRNEQTAAGRVAPTNTTMVATAAAEPPEARLASWPPRHRVRRPAADSAALPALPTPSEQMQHSVARASRVIDARLDPNSLVNQIKRAQLAIDSASRITAKSPFWNPLRDPRQR